MQHSLEYSVLFGAGNTKRLIVQCDGDSEEGWTGFRITWPTGDPITAHTIDLMPFELADLERAITEMREKLPQIHALFGWEMAEEEEVSGDALLLSESDTKILKALEGGDVLWHDIEHHREGLYRPMTLLSAGSIDSLFDLGLIRNTVKPSEAANHLLWYTISAAGRCALKAQEG